MAAELIKALGAVKPTTTAEKIKHIKAIQDLSSILAGARDSSNAYEYASMRMSTHPTTTQSLPAQRVAAPSPRVANAPPPRVATMSNNITAPNVIRTLPIVHQRQTRNNNPFQILSDDDDDDDTVVASNCSPHDPPPILPTSDLHTSQPRKRPTHQLVSPPMNRPTRQLASQPRSPPPTRHRQGCWPARQQYMPRHKQHHTSPSTTCVPHQQRSPASLQHGPSQQHTQFPLLNRMTNEMRCPPRDQPHRHDAPPDSSLAEHPAAFHAKPCTMSFSLVLLWSCASCHEGNHHPLQKINQRSPPQRAVAQGNEQGTPPFGTRMYWCNQRN